MTPTKHDKPRKTKEEIISEAQITLINALNMKVLILESALKDALGLPKGHNFRWGHFVQEAWNKACEDAIKSQETLVIHRQKKNQQIA